MRSEALHKDVCPLTIYCVKVKKMEIILVFTITILLLFLFVFEILPPDQVSLLGLLLLALTNILPVSDLLSGFSNPALITIIAMFVLAGGFTRTGTLTLLSKFILHNFGENRFFVLGMIFLIVLIGSAFLNNTTIVLIFIPLMYQISKIYKIPITQLLMPLSALAVIGGVCTVIGTSTNILASSLSAEAGFGEFGFFEMAPLGIAVSAAGFIFILFIGKIFLPSKPAKKILEEFPLRNYITELLVTVDSSIINHPVNEWKPQRVYELEILAVRSGNNIYLPGDKKTVRAGDFLWVQGSAESILKIQQAEHLVISTAPLSEVQEKAALETGDIAFVEAVIATNSRVLGLSVHEANIRELIDTNIIAIRRRGRVLHRSLADTILEQGDCVLIQGRRDAILKSRSKDNFLLMEPVEPEFIRKDKIPIAIFILALVVVVASLNIYPITITALAGAFIMVLTRCLRIKEAYESVDWRVILIIAALIPLGKALEATGGAELISRQIISTAGSLGPVALLSLLYVLTTIITEILSNTACIVLMFPIAISIAALLNVDAKPFIMAVTFASSLSFLTPIGYQTNTIIYGLGGYKFRDFLKFGTPLNIICWILATLLIPIIWPFY